jgi:hypothetical protein
MKKTFFFFVAVLILTTACTQNSPGIMEENAIKPYTLNKAYWQYEGKPVLLLGATDNDNLFQNSNMKTHLDSLKEVGGNYIRNTMSDRDSGDMHAFYLNREGKYDLNRWNREYWDCFETLLTLAEERDIIVQIEIWDRFDHSREPWKTDPFNPGNNINYSFSESGLDSVYPLHPGRNGQPFFYSVPGLNNNTVLLKYQKLFVEKLLSISLKYNNVLYCIDNETSGEEEWASFWAAYIKEFAGDKDIYVTEMWDDWDVKSATHKRTLDHPDRYGFIDISQNSQISGIENRTNSQYVLNYIKDDPRPVNSTKIYGNDKGQWLSRGITTDHAVKTFFRNISGGFASSRFHRPPSGLGMSDVSVNCIRAVRKVEDIVKMWDIAPRMDLLETEETDEIYLSAKEGEFYVIWFLVKGTAKLDLTDQNYSFTLRWIDISDGEWKEELLINGGNFVTIESFCKGGSIAVLSKN